jgi:hypothetical protein
VDPFSNGLAWAINQLPGVKKRRNLAQLNIHYSVGSLAGLLLFSATNYNAIEFPVLAYYH